MQIYFKIIIVFAAAYLIGSFPSGYVFFRLKTGKDIRNVGLRKNIGATNVFIEGGPMIGMLTVIFDLAKGVIPVIIAKYVFDNVSLSGQLIMITSGIIAILGHVFPIYIGFKGGTGLATSIGALIGIIPEIVISFLVLFLVATPLIKRPAFFGMMLMVLMPFYALLLGYSRLILGITSVMAIMYIAISLNHIGSMLRGDEYKEVREKLDMLE